MPFQTGEVILDHYRVTEVQGAIGSIWYARAVYEFAPQVVYSIKVLPWSHVPDCPLRAAFLSEAERLKVLQTPPYVPLVRHGVSEEGHGVGVHEYLYGRSIYDLSKLPPMSTTECMRIIECVARAMQIAHRVGYAMQGFTHVDLIVNDAADRESSAAHILHAPFPIGTQCHDAVRIHGYLSRYIAPEFRDEPIASIPGDIYSLGMLMSVLLFGSSHAAFLQDPYNFEFGEFEGLRGVILRSTSPDPLERFSTVDGFILSAREAVYNLMRSGSEPLVSAAESRVFATRD